MSTIEIKGTKINYIQQGSGAWDVVCLHGWGQNIAMMQQITDHLQDRFRVTVLDFPGFGASSEPLVSWNAEDYAECLHGFLLALNIVQPILIGHSFGGHIAITYAAKYPVHKMVLTGASGIRPKHGLKWKLKTAAYKLAKKLVSLPGLNRYKEALQQYFGSEDYKNSSGVMRQTLVKVVNHDVSELLEKITMPVLLVWGDQDEAVPLWMGKKMEQAMPAAGLAIFEGEDHYAYWHQWDRFNRCLDIFLKEEGENHD